VFSDDGKILSRAIWPREPRARAGKASIIKGCTLSAVINVLNLKQGSGTGLGGSGFGQLGSDQLQWLEKDVNGTIKQHADCRLCSHTFVDDSIQSGVGEQRTARKLSPI